MVDYIVEHHAGLTALQQLLSSLETGEHTFILITKNDDPPSDLKEVFTTFLDQREDVTSVSDKDWNVGLLEVTCTSAVIIAILANETLLEHLRAVTYTPPQKLH